MSQLRYIFYLVTICSLVAGCEKKRTSPCHDKIIIYNGSADTVLLEIRHGGHENDLCHLESPAAIPPNSIWPDKVINGCWEDQFAASDLFMAENYFVQDGVWNNPSNEYPCDSLDQYNIMLQHNVLSLADLQAMDLVVRYE